MNSIANSTQPRITKDAFFYSCQQSFQARQKKDSFDSHLRFEPFLMQTYALPKAPSVKTLVRELTEVFAHHFQKTPQFKRSDALTLDNCAWFTQAVATLLADVGSLLKFYTNQAIPPIPSEPIEFSDARPVLAAAIAKWQKYLATKTDESVPFSLYPIEDGLVDENAVEPAQQPLAFAAEFWDLLVHNIETTFCADHAQLILEFFDWNFKPVTKDEKPIDWRVRPPVGDLFFRYQKEMGFIRERPRFGDRGGDRKGPPRRDRTERDQQTDTPRPQRVRDEVEVSDENIAASDAVVAAVASANAKANAVRPQRHRDHDNRPSHAKQRTDTRPRETVDGDVIPDLAPAMAEHEQPASNRPKRYTREDAAAHKRERPRFEKPERVEFEDHKQMLEHLRLKAVEQNCLPSFEAAVLDVNNAVQQFKSNKSVMNAPLMPQNPFLRRAQHSLAIELGFDTESTGEGRDRCVVLKRKA